MFDLWYVKISKVLCDFFEDYMGDILKFEIVLLCDGWWVFVKFEDLLDILFDDNDLVVFKGFGLVEIFF